LGNRSKARLNLGDVPAAQCCGGFLALAFPRLVPLMAFDHVGTPANAVTVFARMFRSERRLVFAESRARVEQVTEGLRAAGIRTFASYASLSAYERRAAEAAFAAEPDCAIVATSTLELGVDVGDLDRVVQIGAPASVTSFLQRMGRTGRRIGAQRNCHR
jgi:ATP-dependent helicase Lhr and Lhr-like helicase